MVKLKTDNANATEKARKGLNDNIAVELEVKAKSDAEREQGTEAERDNETTVASPSQTIGSWLFELLIISNTLGVRAPH